MQLNDFGRIPTELEEILNSNHHIYEYMYRAAPSELEIFPEYVFGIQRE